MSDYEIKFITAQDTWDLRHRILRPHQSLKDCVYPYDELSDSFHIGAFNAEKIICVASFNRESHPELKSAKSYRLRGMATEPEYRGHGVGRVVLNRGEQELREKNCDLLWFNAREIAFPFYEKLGFKFLGPLFDIPGIGPHKVMYKHIN